MKISMLLLMTAIIMMSSNIKATADSREELKVGAKFGGNYSNVYDTEGEEFDADAKFGFALGGYVSIPLGKIISIQPELLYSQRGFQGTGKVLGFGYDFTRTTHYLDIPILVVFKPSENISILAGPQYSYLMKQSDDFNNPIANLDIDKEFENDDIRENTFCFVGGVDINVENFVVGARVGWDLFNNNGDGTSTTPRYKNTWVQLTVGFNLFRK